MDNSSFAFLFPLIGIVIGILIGYFYKTYQINEAKKISQDEGERILAHAKENAREIKLQARDEMLKARQEADEGITPPSRRSFTF